MTAILTSKDAKFVIVKPSCVIGRNITADVIVRNVIVSRIHCVIEQKDNGVWTITNKSSSGTWINEHKMPPEYKNILRNGDTIYLGEPNSDVNYTFSLTAPQTQTPKAVADMSKMIDVAKAEWEKQKEVNANLRLETEKLVMANQEAAREVAELHQKMDDEVKARELMTLAPAVEEILDSELQCSVCTEYFITPVTINCSHTFCADCLKQWMAKQKYCPICRARIINQNVTLALDNCIKKLVEKLSDEQKQTRLQIIQQRTKAAGDVKSVGRGRGRSSRRGRRQRRSSPYEVIVLDDTY